MAINLESSDPSQPVGRAQLMAETASPSSDGTSIDRLRRLYRFMSVREFIASRDELLGAGFMRSQIDSWIRTGRLVRVVRSVYSYGRGVDTPAALRRAALLIAGEGSALTGRSACEALQIVKPPPGPTERVLVASPSGQTRHFGLAAPHRQGARIDVVRRDLVPRDVAIEAGIAIVRAPLALIEMAAEATERDVRFAFLEACRLRQFRRRDLQDCFPRLSHRRGACKLRPCLELWVPELERTRSVLEGWYILVQSGRGYRTPLVNVKIFGYEVDCYWPEDRFVLELDGDTFHQDPVQKRIDLVKQQELERHGLRVMRVTFREFDRDPEGVVDQVERERTRR